MADHPYKVLVMTLLPKPLFCLTTHDSPASFMVDKTIFREIDHYPGYGFYDWLRTTNGKVIGVRWIFWSSEQQYNALLPKHDYIESEDMGDSLLFYFLDQRDFDPMRSADQDFDENKIFCAEDGTYAITFGVDWLEADNIERLQKYPLQWVPITLL